MRALTWTPSLAAAALSIGVASAQVGANYCAPAVPNSTGLPARISALGSNDLSVNNNQLTLRTEDLPASQFGFFATSRTQGLVTNAGASQGSLCLGGAIGRYVGSGQVLNAGAGGSFEIVVDLSMTPEGGNYVQVGAGETWNFQAWYRDIGPNGEAWSNFTDGLEVAFTAGGVVPVPPMAPIPAGTFLMGSDAPNAAPYFNSGFQPVHQVTISYAFWIGQFEVTQSEYQALMGANPSFQVGPDLPVDSVGWDQARAYCAALTAQQAANLPTGFEYRLPTEAEWEYACRAGTTTEFHFGSALDCNQARISFSYHMNPAATCGIFGSVPVGSFAPNAFGLYDMHGNIKEWCLDSWGFLSAMASVDPFVSGGQDRIVRGGGWFNQSSVCRSASRDSGLLGGEFNLGFRVVLAPALVP